MSSFRDSIRDSNAGAYLLLFLSFLFFNLVGALFLQWVGFHWTTIASEVFGILGAAVLWHWVLGDAAAKWPSFRLGVSPVALLVVVAAAVSLGLLANTLASLLVELSPTMRGIAESYTEQLQELVLGATGLERVLGLIGVCVAAPLCEEVLFRGTILQEQRKREGFWLAAIVNGVAFSLFHLNPVSAPGLALIGIFLAYVTIRSGSIWPAIVGHAAINTTSALVLPAIYPEAATAEVPLEISGILVAIAALGALSALLWWLTARLIPQVSSANARSAGD